MKTLLFASRLEKHPFSGYNNYVFSNAEQTNIGFNGHDNHELFITRAEMFDADNIYVSNTPALNGRALNNARVSEVFDGAGMPMRVELRGIRFYIGKGFIGLFKGIEDFRVLLAACIPKSLNTINASMKDIRFYVDKDAVKSDEFAAIRTVLKEALSGHPGEILYTENMKRYFTKFQFIPDGFKTLEEIQSFKTNLITKSIEKAILQVEDLQLPR